MLCLLGSTVNRPGGGSLLPTPRRTQTKKKGPRANEARDREEVTLMADTSVRPSPLKEQQDGFKDGYADRPHQRGRTGIYRNGWKAGRAARIEDEWYAQLARIRGVEVSA